MTLRSTRFALCLLPCTTIVTVRAQVNPDSTSDDADLAVETVQLETVTVEPDLLPLSVPSFSDTTTLFGPHRDVLTSPRSLSVVSQAILDDALIRDLGDLVRVSSSADAPNTFGLPSLPRIRGQEGEIFQNGMRRAGGNNGFGLPISFNSAERMDIVKGPPTTVLGPTRRVGGYVDLHTKRPDLSNLRVNVGGAYGSHEHYLGTIDVSTPIAPEKSGLRISWEHLDEESFYDFVETQSDSIYVAYRNQLSDRVRLDLNTEFYEADYSDNGGLNRPTQDLIDNGIYVTGTGISPAFNDALQFPGSPSDPVTFTDGSASLRDYVLNNSTIGPDGIRRFDPGAELDPTPGPRAIIAPGLRINPDGTIEEIDPTVHIDRDRVLTDPKDFSEARTFIGQALLDIDLGGGASLVNRTHLQYLEKDQINQNSFVEIIEDLYTINNRTELALDFNLDLGALDLGNRTLTGVDLRYHRVTGYSQFTTEADNPVDLTADVATRRISNEAVARRLGLAPDQLGERGLVELRDDVFVSPGFNYDIDDDGVGDFALSDTNETDLYQLGLFHQHDLQLTKQWSLLTGGRIDFYHAEGRDPIPAPGQNPVSDDISDVQGAFNTSLVFAPMPWMSYYVTYNYSQSVNSALGGGLTLDANGELAESDFDNESELLEVGTKANLFEDRLFLALAGYYQTRNQRQRDGSTLDIEVYGAEFETVAEPMKGLIALFNVSYTDAHFVNESPFQGTRRVEDAFDTRDASGPAPIDGTAAGSPNFVAVERGDYRLPGLPVWSINGVLSYTHAIGLGATLSGEWESEQNLDINRRVVIPAQYTINTGLFYRHENFELRFDVLNVTNEPNYSPVFNGFFGGTLVIPEEPRTYLISLSLFL